MSRMRIVSYLKDNLINKSLKVLLLRISGAATFLLLSLFLTNYFDPELVGKYDFVRSSLLILGGICLLGTNQAIIFYSGILIAQDSLGSLKRVYRKMVAIILGTSAIFIGLVVLIDDAFFIEFFNKSEAADLIFQIVLVLAAFALTMLNIDTLRGLKQTLYSELYRNVFRYLPFFLGAVIIFFTQHTIWLVEVYLFGFVLLAILSSIQVMFAFNKKTFLDKGVRYTTASIFKKSYPMALSAVSYYMMQSIDIILLGKFSTFENVAFYSVAVKLATASALALHSVTIIIAPKIAELFVRKRQKQLKSMIRSSARLILGLSIPALIVLAIFSSFFLGIFGEQYIVAKNALLILLLGQLFNSLCGPVAIYMDMTGKQNKLHQILIFGFVINLVLNWFLIPLYGMEGAAIATALSMIIWNLIAVIYTYRTDRIKTFIS